MSLEVIAADKNRRLNISRFNSSERRKRVVPLSFQMFGQVLNVMSRVRNEWAASILSNLWFTVFKGKTKPWMTEFWQQADARIDVRLKAQSLPVYLWGQGPLVVVMHGWSGSGLQFRRLIPGLVEAGYQVAAFDAPAHGINPGKKSDLLDFSDSLLAIQQQVGAIDTLMAHSLGGMAAVVATHRGLKPRRVVLFGPHLDLNQMHQSYSELLNLNPRLSARFRDKLEQKIDVILGTDDNWSFLTPSSLLARSTYSGLLVYDAKDEEIPTEQFKAIERHWRQCRTVVTEGLGHSDILKDDGVIDKVLAYLGEPSDR